MLNKDALFAEIDSMVQLIEAARESLRNDRMVDLSQIQDRVREAVTSVQLLPVEEAQEVRPFLTTLLKEMQSFSLELQTRIDTLDGDGDGDGDGDENGDGRQG